jgi:hypothetical protein
LRKGIRTAIAAVLLAGLFHPMTAIAADSAAECEQAVNRLAGTSKSEAARVAITFTGTQAALGLLDSAGSKSDVDATLFPVDRGKFVLFLQLRRSVLDSPELGTMVKNICALGSVAGSRFNGAMLFIGKDMTDAAFAKLPGY